MYKQPHATHADFAVFDVINTAVHNPLYAEHAKKALEEHPDLNAWYHRVADLPAIKAWTAKRPESSF